MGYRVRGILAGLALLSAPTLFADFGSIDEQGYVRILTEAGTPILCRGRIRHNPEIGAWQIDYWGDRIGTRYVKGPFSVSPSLFDWLAYPEVGVRSVVTGKVKYNAVPLGITMDLTTRPYRLRMDVRGTAGKSGQYLVDAEQLTEPDPKLKPNKRPSGLEESIDVVVKFLDGGKERIAIGEVFMNEPIALHGKGNRVDFAYEGFYRWKDRNRGFTVDIMKTLEAQQIVEHHQRVVVPKEEGAGYMRMKPDEIVVDLTDGEPVVEVGVDSAMEKMHWTVPVEEIGCEKIVVEASQLKPGARK